MHNWDLGCYKVTEIAKRVWVVENNQFFVYVLEGNDKCLLIDTGWGIGNLYELVTKLTSLPLMVVNTHGHPDHVGGNYQFDNIYIHHGDELLMRSNFESEVRTEILDKFVIGRMPSDFSKDIWINASLNKVWTFTGEQTLDLGNRVIEVIEIPGHTYGSICLFDRKEGFLFTGDSVSQRNILLHFQTSAPLSLYLKGINKLLALKENLNYILPSHNNTLLTPNILMELKSGVQEILRGEIKGAYHTTFLGSGLLCKFETCGILYREDNIF